MNLECLLLGHKFIDWDYNTKKCERCGKIIDLNRILILSSPSSQLQYGKQTMYSLGQTLRENGNDTLILYLGWKGDLTYFTSEDGKLNAITPSKFRSKYTHINDEFDMPIAGVHEHYGDYFGFWKEGVSLRPDLRLRRYLFINSDDSKILRKHRIEKILLVIINFINSDDKFLNLSNGDSAYTSDSFWKSLEITYPYFRFKNRDFYLIDSVLIVREGCILERVLKRDCEMIFTFMKKYFKEIE